MKRKCYGLNLFISPTDKYDMSFSVTSVRAAWYPTIRERRYKNITRSSLTRLEYLSTTHDSRVYLNSVGTTICIFNS